MKFKYLIATLPLFSSIANAADVSLLMNTVDTKNWYISNGWSDANWNYCMWDSKAITIDNTRLKFTIANSSNLPNPKSKWPWALYTCGELQSYSQQNYGTYTVSLKTASGSGLNTAFFTYNANPHDEIDFEFLGLHPTQVSINYWVNGVNQMLKPVELGFDASKDFHIYTLIYTPTSIAWFADGKQLFQTKAGAKMPTSLARMYLEFWAGYPGWMGGFKYTTPVSAEYESVSFTPYVGR